MFAPRESLFRHFPMRLALLGFSAFLLALPLSAQTFSHVSQSSVTLAATYSRPGDFDKTVTEHKKDDDYTVSFSASTVRFGNSQLLDVLVEKEKIPEKKGWAIVAVWADWESNGASSYKFFARKKVAGSYQTIEVPPAILRLELLDPYVIKTVKTDAESEELISGSDRFKAYSRLTLDPDPDAEGAVDDTDEAGRSIAASAPLGMIAGSGRYARPSGADAVFYLPNSASFLGYAISSPYASGSSDVVVASLKLAQSKAIPSVQYEDDFTGENPSRGIDSTAVVLP
jgi:hypothetical protein